MDQLETLKKEIEKTEQILKESAENLKKNPEDYSAKLLYMTMENHLGDLLQKLDIEEMKQNLNKSGR